MSRRRPVDRAIYAVTFMHRPLIYVGDRLGAARAALAAMRKKVPSFMRKDYRVEKYVRTP